MFDYFRNYSSNPHHVCCEDSNISVSIYTMASKLGMTVDLSMVSQFMLVSMSLTLMQGHSGPVWSLEELRPPKVGQFGPWKSYDP